MSHGVSIPRAGCARMEHSRVDARLSGCACLPSLSTVDSALRELLDADESHTSAIAEIIQRDPSLTARLLHLVNAVHYGAAKTPKGIDEAVFYLGIRQIRQLAMVTQIIEDFQNIAQGSRFPWRQFWRHCIATGLMTRQITDLVQASDNSVDYVAGLIHDVGKIVMASAFPDHFQEICDRRGEEGEDLLLLERDVLGVDHAELGAMYLKKQRLPEMYVEIAQHHHAPQLARHHKSVTAAVHVADMLVRFANIGDSGNTAQVTENAWLESPAWNIVFGHQNEEKLNHSNDALRQGLERIPAILETLV